ncbi:MAG: LacI family DNA-binding transcriptional regulator [Arachnia sp.]
MIQASSNPPTRKSKPTLDVVAREAGVSKATVSKVLNRRPNISADTRALVEEVIERLGYVPSTGPRLGSELRQVNIVFDTLINVHSLQVLDAVVAASAETGIDVVVNVLNHRHRDDAAPLSSGWVKELAAKGSVGVIIVTSELTPQQRRRFRQADLGVVVIDPVNPLDDDTVSVGSANFAGGVQATRHLLDLGHRRIAFAGGPPNSAAARERLQAFRSTMETAGIEPDPRFVLQEDFRFESGVRMSTSLLGAPDPPTAIFAGCDASALGAIEVARRRGLRVPEDLSIIGFDDTYAAAMSAPPLTTIRQPLTDIGRVALRTLLQLTRGERPDSHHIQLATRLIVRDSTSHPTAAH